MAKLTEYELERERNIARNRELLKQLDIDNLASSVKAIPTAPKQKEKISKKRKERDDVENEPPVLKMEQGEREEPRKVAQRETNEGGEATLRRSSRNAGKKVDYAEVEKKGISQPSLRVFTKSKKEMGSDPRDTLKRTQDPKKYGSIPGIEVGTWWETRQACSMDAIHAPWVAGIAVGPKGAYSIALSGGYEDDVDLGVAFTYTGSGGRDLKGTKDKPKNLRTAPQSSDQTFDNHCNKALQLSAETGLPVRVIRGYKLKSEFAPAEGYRYDGLYKVNKAWQEKGLNIKFKVCKFAFTRLPNQSPLPKRDLEAEARLAETSGNEKNEVDDVVSEGSETSEMRTAEEAAEGEDKDA